MPDSERERRDESRFFWQSATKYCTLFATTMGYSFVVVYPLNCMTNTCVQGTFSFCCCSLSLLVVICWVLAMLLPVNAANKIVYIKVIAFNKPQSPPYPVPTTFTACLKCHKFFKRFVQRDRDNVDFERNLEIDTWHSRKYICINLAGAYQLMQQSI